MNEVATAALQPYPLLFSLPHNRPLALLVVEAELLDGSGLLPLIKKQRAPRDEPKSALKTNGG
jgi:hypothetical protein